MPFTAWCGKARRTHLNAIIPSYQNALQLPPGLREALALFLYCFAPSAFGATQSLAILAKWTPLYGIARNAVVSPPLNV